MSARQRKPNELTTQVMPLLLLGMGLVASNHYVIFVDDEVRSLDAAAQPVRTLVTSFLTGPGHQDLPPLYGIVLHFWLRWTAWNFEYLRIPAIAFFLIGLFLLARAARRFSGPIGASATIWVGILWPLGFHYGRLAAPYSFLFFLIAGLTLTYLRFLEERSFGRWAAVFLFGAALLWTNFFGWALLACLAIDQALRRRAGERTVPITVAARTVILWFAAFIPLLRPSYGDWTARSHVHRGLLASFTNCALQVYNLFVSESIAPWRWQLSVLAGIAVLACIVLVFLKGTVPSRRFFSYSAILIIFMAAMRILAPGTLFFVAPWVILSIAAAIASIDSPWARPSLALALLIVGGLGWSGIYMRRYYSTPQFLEPWAQVAGEAANKIQTGATAISNSRAFFFYLTYAVRPPTSGPESKMEGLLPDFASQPNVKSPQQWLSGGHPLAPTMLWIHGTDSPEPDTSMDDASRELDHSCGSRISRLMAHDAGFAWKQRFLSESVGSQWRIESREYDCASSNTQEIFSIPAK
jgi:hypothetical protein